MWIWHVEPSSTSPVVNYHGDSLSSVNYNSRWWCTNGVHKHCKNLKSQFRWEQKCLLLTWRKYLPNRGTKCSLLPQLSISFPNSVNIHSFSCPFLFLALQPRAEGIGTRNFYAKWVLFCPKAAHSRAGFFLWSKQRGKSSTSKGRGGGCFGGSDERRVPWCKLQFGPQRGRGRRRLQSLRWLQDVWQEPWWSR